MRTGHSTSRQWWAGWKGWVGLITLGLLVATLVQAQEKSVAEEILDILRASGQIGEQQYRTLVRKAQVEEQRRHTAADRQPTEVRGPEKGQAKDQESADPPTSPHASWSNGFHLETADRRFQLKIGALIQNDCAIVNTDKDIRDDVNDGLSIGDGTEFRRARRTSPKPASNSLFDDTFCAHERTQTYEPHNTNVSLSGGCVDSGGRTGAKNRLSGQRSD